MLGRLPWLAFERRNRALRFFVFFDMVDKPNAAVIQLHPAHDRGRSGGGLVRSDAQEAVGGLGRVHLELVEGAGH